MCARSQRQARREARGGESAEQGVEEAEHG